MKTMNSILRKAGLETLAILAVIFITCFTLCAQGADFKKILKGQDELALTESGNSELGINLNISAELVNFKAYLDVEKEEELVIENWMTDAAVFHATELENENQLKVENWMVNELLFQTIPVEKNKEEEAATVKPASRPKVIGVTFPDTQFGRRTFIHIEMEDPILELENWMVDNKLWKIRKK
jgi:hypothetical protein